MTATSKCRCYQFSLRTLLVVVTVAAFFFGWIALEQQKSQRRRAAVEAIAQHGSGRIVSDIDEARRSIPLRLLLGDDGVGSVRRIGDWWGSDVAGALAHVGSFPELRELDLHDTQVTDADLVYLASLTNLETLNLSGTKVTGAGVDMLQFKLPNLKITHNPAP